MLLDQHSGSQHGPLWMRSCRARNHAGRAVCSLGTDVGGEGQRKSRVENAAPAASGGTAGGSGSVCAWAFIVFKT